MSSAVSDFFVCGGFSEGWLECDLLDERTAFHLAAHVGSDGMIDVHLEKIPGVPVSPWHVGGGLRDFGGGGLGGFVDVGLLKRPVQQWDGLACGTCRVGDLAGMCEVVGCGRRRVGMQVAETEVLVTSSIMVAVQRAAIALAPDDMEFWDTVPVRVSAGGYTFIKDMSLDLAAESEVITSGAEKLLADFFRSTAEPDTEVVMLSQDDEEAVVASCADHEVGWGNLATLSPCVAVDGADDDVVSVVSGRGDDVGFEVDTTQGDGLGEHLDDFLFLRGGTAVEKSRSVAGNLLALLRRVGGTGVDAEGVVVIFGDSPGVVARELASVGYRVLGVDKDPAHAAPPGWLDKYRTVVAEVTDGLTSSEVEGWLAQVGWGGKRVLAALMDIDQGSKRSSVSDTALNRELSANLLADWSDAFTVVRYRGLPVLPIDAYVLPTRFHEPQGAEMYAVHGLEGPALADLAAFHVSSWHVAGSVSFGVQLLSKAWRDYGRRRGLGYEGGGKGDVSPEGGERKGFTGKFRVSGATGYLSLLGLRSGVEELRLAHTPFMRAGKRARAFVELLGQLKTVMGKVRPERVAELTAKFQPADRVLLRHVSQATLSVSPTLLHTMQSRYDGLLKYCSAAELPDQGPDLGDFTKHPGFGALFHWGFSKVRDEMGVVFPYTQYARVLPLAAMPILASRSWVRMVAWLLKAYDRLMGKPLHTWELQGLLWSLSHVGTQEEREVYFWGKLQGAADLLLASRRRGQRTQGAASADLNRILSAAEALGSRKLKLSPAERMVFGAAYGVVGRGQFRHDSDYSRNPPGGLRYAERPTLGRMASTSDGTSHHRTLSSSTNGSRGVYTPRRIG
ncbi:hypothetical protein AltMyV_sM1gp1 [Alternaria alternata virus 1]|uniref:Uncharacterized protein n=1 Tax=Alternaria alternata virus 1 TaxID=483537 RepID=B3IXK2_9VIRU|nr:hypothetical protein AltMyV_sM1gp1 [Alternaria alternata virus 1]BAG49049.1 hypothetical protein [Alternaria alternata virus 1]